MSKDLKKKSYSYRSLMKCNNIPEQWNMLLSLFCWKPLILLPNKTEKYDSKIKVPQFFFKFEP